MSLHGMPQSGSIFFFTLPYSPVHTQGSNGNVTAALKANHKPGSQAMKLTDTAGLGVTRVVSKGRTCSCTGCQLGALQNTFWAPGLQPAEVPAVHTCESRTSRSQASKLTDTAGLGVTRAVSKGRICGCTHGQAAGCSAYHFLGCTTPACRGAC